jgi:hypothetical protein
MPISWMVTPPAIPIRESYENYIPPRWVRPTVERLLSSVSDSCAGLSAIVLTNSQLSSKSGRRKRHHRGKVVIGRYHSQSRGEPAWIELVVDRILEDVPRGLLWMRHARDFQLGRVLFHEVGHHLDHTIGSAARSGEPAAEAWRKRLMRRHLRKYYSHLRRFMPLVMTVGRGLLFFVRKMAALEKQRNERRSVSRR